MGSYLTESALRQRGWTGSMIARFLTEPDTLRENPRNPAFAPMKLYSLSRVEQVEATSEFQNAKIAAVSRKGPPVALRKAASAKATATKRNRAATLVAGFTPSLPDLGREEFIRRACDYYNAWRGRNEKPGKYTFEPASPASNPAFLRAICFKYIGELLGWHQLMEQLVGLPGAATARASLKEKRDDAIATAYPWLKEMSDGTESRSDGSSGGV